MRVVCVVFVGPLVSVARVCVNDAAGLVDGRAEAELGTARARF
jgi:hypothetical protein